MKWHVIKCFSFNYSKPNVTAVEVLPVFPDFVNWKYPCAQVIFDSDPAPANKNVPAQIEEMSQAMIRYEYKNITILFCDCKKYLQTNNN